MPCFLVPLYEFNQCHNPAGEGGGQFCSDELSPSVVSLARMETPKGDPGTTVAKQRRLARRTDMLHAHYEDRSGRIERDAEATRAIMAHVDRFGSITVQVGTEGRRRFGQRKLEKLLKLVKHGLLERLPSHGVTPIMAKAAHMNKKVRGYSTEHVFRRKAK